MNRSPIGVFDSGVGGLSVMREIRKALPHEDLIYVADSGFAPYGDRSSDFIHERSETITQFFIDQGVKAIVVACNTATAVAVHHLRTVHSLPIVAMEPALKPAAESTRSGIIGILATSRTLQSENFARLAERFGRGVTVLQQACPGFVEAVEKACLADHHTESLVRRYVAPLLEQHADTLVLGCTHYPFLLPLLQKVAGTQVTIIDPSPAVARELRRRLTTASLLTDSTAPGAEQFWTSGNVSEVQPVTELLWGKPVNIKELAPTYCQTHD